MKGKIMLRLYPEMKALTQGKDKAVQAAHYAIGNFVHPKTGLMLKSEPEGFFVEDGNFELGDVLSVREDFPVIVKVSFQEPSDHPAVVSTGCGTFVYKTTTIKISYRGGYPAGNLWISIIASSVTSFNEAVQALKNGELKPVGSERTVLLAIMQEFQEIAIKLAEVENQKLCLHVAAEETGRTLQMFERFIHQTKDCLLCPVNVEYDAPEHMGHPLLSTLASAVARIKEREETLRYKLMFHPVDWLRGIFSLSP